MKPAIATAAFLALLSTPALASDSKQGSIKPLSTQITDTNPTKGVIVADEITEI